MQYLTLEMAKALTDSFREVAERDSLVRRVRRIRRGERRA
jgi:hypothetical protein